MKNKILAFMLAIVMATCLFPSGALGADETSTKSYTCIYETSDGGISTTTEITLNVDFGKMTGSASFVRTEAKLTFMGKNIPTADQKRQSLMKEGSATFTVSPKTDSDQFSYTLDDFLWKTEPYILGVKYINKAYEDGVPVSIYLTNDRKHYADSMSIQYPSVGAVSAPRFTEVEKKYVFGQDNFSFANSFSSFYPSNSASVQGPGIVYLGDKSQAGTNGYYIKPDSYKTMTDGLSNSEIAAVNTMMNKAFFGNCFGMSVSSGLFFDGKLQLPQFDNSVKTVYELGKPLNNATLREAIVYYQLSQQLGNVASVKQTAGWGETSNNLGLINTLKVDLPSPVVFNIVIDKDGKLSGHALLAYDMKDSGSDYVISVYDPNNPNTPLTLTVSSDGKKAAFATTYKDVSIGYAMKASSIVNNTSFNSSLKPCKVPTGGAVVTANTGTLTISAGQDTAKFVNGKKVSGKLNAICLGPSNETGEETEVLFLMNPLTGKGPVLNYRVSGIRSFKENNLKIQARFAADNGESFVSVQSENDCDLNMNTNGTIEAKQTSAKKMQVSYASDKTKGKLFGTTVCVVGTGITLVSSTGGTTVKPDSNAKVKIELSGATEAVSFNDVDISKTGADIKTAGNNVTITDSDSGKTLATSVASENSSEYLKGFAPTKEYNNGQFSDVGSGAWYDESIKMAYQLGIINGNGNGKFDPDGKITTSQAIKMACVLRSTYAGDNADFSNGNPWYKPYVDYAIKNGIIMVDQFVNFDSYATRAEMAAIFANGVPASELSSINNVKALLDVSESATYGSQIFLLYRAGVLTGNDAKGTFTPSENISRAQAAAIITRIAVVSQRRELSF